MNTRPWVRWTLVTLAVLVGAAAAAVAAGAWLAERKMTRHVDVTVAPIALPSDAAALDRGRYLFRTRGCTDCHGVDGAGRTLIDKDGLKIAGPHIGNGARSVTARYEVTDWVRAIRHGVAPGGRAWVAVLRGHCRETRVEVYRVVTTLQSFTARPAVWAGWAGKEITADLVGAALLRNEVASGPFRAEPLRFRVLP